MYIDPSTGSMIIQAIIAAIPVLGAALIAFRNKLFRIKKKPEKEMEATTTPQDDSFEVIDSDDN